MEKTSIRQGKEGDQEERKKRACDELSVLFRMRIRLPALDVIA